MKPKEQVRELGARFQIETPHMEHVTSLALKLFDGFGFDKKDRPLLAAAARLHDIGYATDPDNHIDAGLRILEENPLPAFSSRDWKTICLIVSLHRRDWRTVLTEEVKSEFSEKRLERAKAMAAALRIADGLDHSHIQDTSIRFCRRGNKVDKVGVKVRWYAKNVEWAEGKADLWEAVFKRSLRIKAETDSSKDLFDGVVGKQDSALSAARKIFYSQYDIMRDRVPCMLEGRDPECLHEYRVALRRFRTALKLFRPLLGGTSAQELQIALGDLSDRLGTIRDAHVRLAFFQSLDAGGSGSRQTSQTLEENVSKANRKLAEILESNECQRAVRQLSRFLRVELPELGRESDDGPDFRRFVRKKLKRLKKRIAAAELTDHPEEMHEVRKQCRRARYIAEFAAPVLGKETRQLARRLKKVAGTLGDLRDLHLHAEKADSTGFPFDTAQGRHCLENFDRLRTEAGSDFSKAWKALHGCLK